MVKQVKSLEELRGILSDGETREFYIQLNYGLRSSKAISYDGDDTFYVLNEIDGTEQELTGQELMDGDITNIGKAIENGSFYLDE